MVTDITYIPYTTAAQTARLLRIQVIADVQLGFKAADPREQRSHAVLHVRSQQRCHYLQIVHDRRLRPTCAEFFVDAVFSNSLLAYKIETHEDYYLSFSYFLYDVKITMMQRIQLYYNEWSKTANLAGIVCIGMIEW